MEHRRKNKTNHYFGLQVMKIVFYDIETSGLIAKKHEIIQIAAIAFSVEKDWWQELEQFEVKLNFDLNRADPQALENNCYDQALWAREAIAPLPAVQAFSGFLRKYADVKRIGRKSGKSFYCCRTAGHNIKNFDDPFVREFFSRMNMFCPIDFMEAYDTLQLALWAFGLQSHQPIPENYQLGTLCRMLDIPLDNAHDALSDIRANSRLAQTILRL